MNDKNNKNNKPELTVKPSGDYLSSLSEFASLLGTIDEADKAAKELLDETKKNADGGAAPAKEEAAALPKPDLDEALKKLDELVGLEKIKTSVRSLINFVKVRKLREENELPNAPVSLHMVFLGNPGTGKTTVARILAEIYHAVGALTKGQLVETDRSGLVAGYVGQTAIKTSEVVKKAIGGILFIDEAYSLVPENSSNDFGHEAVETLLKLMEDNRGDLVVIVAGYSGLMENFINSNPGLESRFNRYFFFEDYSSNELFTIFSGMCEKNKYILGEGAADFALDHFREMFETRDENFGNARDIRNFFENLVSTHSDRISAIEGCSVEELTTLLTEDLEKAALL